MIELTGQERGRDGAHLGHTDSMGPAVRAGDMARCQRQVFA